LGTGDKLQQPTLSLPGLTGQSINHHRQFARDHKGYWIPAFAGMTMVWPVAELAAFSGFVDNSWCFAGLALSGF
jgi:hypothetical protein